MNDPAVLMRDRKDVVGLLMFTLVLFAVAAVHLGLARVRAFSIMMPFQVSLLWLPAGFGMAACLVLGSPAVLSVFLAALANNLMYGAGLAVAMGTSAGSAAQCVLLAMAIGRWCGIGVFASNRDAIELWSAGLLRFYVLIALGATVAPTIGSFVLCISRTVPWTEFTSAWLGWWVGDSLGIAVVAPIVFQAGAALRKRTGIGSWQQVAAMSIIPLGLLVIVGGVAQSLDLEVRLPEGLSSKAWLLLSTVVAGGTMIGVGAVLLRASQLVSQLFERGSQYQMLAENAQDYIQQFSRELKPLYSSPNLVRDFVAVTPDIPLARVHPDDRARMIKGLQTIFETGMPAPARFRLIRRDGCDNHYEGVAKPVFSDGQVASVIVGFRDVSERIKAEQKVVEQAQQLARLNLELERRADSADTANRAKSEFLSTMSHELRTPLNAVIGYAHLLRDARLEPEPAGQVEQILASSKHLLTMISGALDLSRIEAGELRLDSESFSLRELVGQVEAMLGGQARQKGLELRIQFKGDVGPRLRGDPVRLRQCILNYVANGVKFTEHGHVTLIVEALPGSDGNVQLRIEVHDSGPGVLPAYQQALFQPFQQGDMSSRRRHRGTGLGLVITRRLAQAMGGDAGFTSVPGLGSRFWFTAWVNLDQQAGVGAGEEGEGAELVVGAPQGQGLPGPANKLAGAHENRLRERYVGARVLLVEDEPINQAMMQILLKKAGLQVEVAHDGAQAVAMAAAVRYDCVLMDVHMPGMSGMEATWEIRKLPGWRQVPIIALTADALEQTRTECVTAGMDAFVTKPVDPPVLFTTILGCLEGQHGRQTLQAFSSSQAVPTRLALA